VSEAIRAQESTCTLLAEKDATISAQQEKLSLLEEALHAERTERERDKLQAAKQAQAQAAQSESKAIKAAKKEFQLLLKSTVHRGG